MPFESSSGEQFSSASNESPSNPQSAENALESKLNELKKVRRDIPRFGLNEIHTGEQLGKGSFGVVYEITGIDLMSEEQYRTHSARENGIEHSKSAILDVPSEMSESETQRDSVVEQRFKEDVDQREMFVNSFKVHKSKFAVKLMRLHLSKQDMINAVIDLAIEANILADIAHENIVKLRAVSSKKPLSKSFFIILDRLFDTLDKRLIFWLDEVNRNTSSCMCMSSRKSIRLGELLRDRFRTLFDLSSALKYIHEKSIIFRDLKPENVGYDAKDSVKLFDFGLSKRLEEEDKTKDGLYKITGGSGSRRYMAPEVAQYKPYDGRVDIFSFAILFWQMMALETPFPDFTVGQHEKLVVKDGLRPPINKAWPPSWGEILNQCWHADLHQRPRFDTLYPRLADEFDVVEKHGLAVSKSGRTKEAKQHLIMQLSTHSARSELDQSVRADRKIEKTPFTA